MGNEDESQEHLRIRHNYGLGSYTLRRCSRCLEKFMSLGNMYKKCRYCGYKNRGGL